MEKITGRLLCVDDEENILLALRHLLAAEGHEVYTALNGQEGLGVLEKHSIDLIVSDMNMPNMDGTAFLKIASERWPNIKRILLTANSDFNKAVSAINEGKIDYFFSKPWNNEGLIKTISSLLENKLLKDQNIEFQKKITDQNKQLKLLANCLNDRVKERTAQLNQSLEDLNATHDAAIQVFLSIKELYESTSKGYSKSVAQHAKLLAQEAKLDEKDTQTVYLAALLHNLGKHGLTREIIFKPFTKLTAEEHKEFIQHPIISATILSTFPILTEVSNTILYHKEYYNGRGFPYNFKGESIPLFSRILTLAVDFNELQYGLIFPEKYHALLALKYMKERAEYYDSELLPLFAKIIKGLPDDEIILHEIPLRPYQLKPGMILSRDLVSQNGLTFLIKEYQLTENVISKIQDLNDLIVYVYQNKGTKTDAVDNNVYLPERLPNRF